MTSRDLMSCLLCHSILPAVDDDIFDNHMAIQHRAFFNKDFFFSAFHLDTNDLKSVVMYIEDIKKSKEQTKDEITCNKEGNSISKDEEKVFENAWEHKSISLEDILLNKCENVTIKPDKFQPEVIMSESHISISVTRSYPKTKQENNLYNKKEHICECKNLGLLESKALNYHNKTIHWNHFGCKKCLRTFKSKEIAERHLNEHTLVGNHETCAECGKGFRLKISLKDHVNLVHDKQPQVCEVCSKVFLGKLKLKRHIQRFHVNLKQCTLCPKMVKNVYKHEQVVHIDQNKFQCEACPKGFIEKYKLMIHTKSVHTKEKLFVCR